MLNLMRQFAFSETKLLQLYQIETPTKHKGWWLILIEQTIPDKILSHTSYVVEKEALDAFLNAIERR